MTTTTTTTTDHHASGDDTSHSTLRRCYAPLLDPGTWRDTAALLVALPAGTVWFTVAVTGLSLAAGLAITVVGVPILAAVLLLARRLATIERRATGGLLGAGIDSHPPLSRDGTWWRRTRRIIGDRAAWKGVLYALVSLPIGVVTFTTAIVLWSVTAACTAFPVYQAFVSDVDDDVPAVFSSGLHGWGRVVSTVVIGAVGLVLLAVTPRLIRGVAETRRRMARRFYATTVAP